MKTGTNSIAHKPRKKNKPKTQQNRNNKVSE